MDELGGLERSKRWMQEALAHAEQALARGEVPVGCLFILDERVLAVGSNEVNETKNATRHAEMTCVDSVLDWCKKEGTDYAQVFPQVYFSFSLVTIRLDRPTLVQRFSNSVPRTFLRDTYKIGI